MKDFLHKPVSLDSFFKEKLGELPIDVAGCELQWQSIRQRVKQGPPRLPGSALTIGFFAVVSMLTLVILFKNQNAPGKPDNQSPLLPVQENRYDSAVEKKDHKKPAATSILYHEPVDSGAKQFVPASPVISTNGDSAKKIMITTRPDSIRKIPIPESKKDSLFIFW